MPLLSATDCLLFPSTDTLSKLKTLVLSIQVISTAAHWRSNIVFWNLFRTVKSTRAVFSLCISTWPTGRTHPPTDRLTDWPVDRPVGSRWVGGTVSVTGTWWILECWRCIHILRWLTSWYSPFRFLRAHVNGLFPLWSLWRTHCAAPWVRTGWVI